jgi:hypothetical protein
MRLGAWVVALAVAAPAAAQVLPPPPPGRAAADVLPQRADTIGEIPIAPAGSQAAPIQPDEATSRWRGALASGVAGKLGGLRIADDRRNARVLLYFGAQADGLWTEGYGRAARLRIRLFTGGEDEIYVPSDGDAEAAYMIGPPELRFVIGRVEVGRYPALGIGTLAQVATLPCFEGSVSLAGDTMRLTYYLSPIEGTWVHYRGSAHIEHSAEWASESDRPAAASAARLRYTVVLPPSVLLSVQGDLMKLWRKADLMLGAEGSLGYPVLRRAAVFHVAIRWNSYTRRGLNPGSSERESEVLLLGVATLAL